MKLRGGVFGLLVLLLLAVSSLAIINRVSADNQATNLTSSPVLLNLNIKPGTTSSQTVQLMNNASTPVGIQMVLKTFGANGAGGQAQINNLPKSSPLYSYIKFSPSTFTAQPKVWSNVTVTISLPPNASLGYYFAIDFQPVYSNQKTPGKNAVHSSNAILVLIDTGSANELRQVQIANFSVDHRVYEYLPVNFNVLVHNSGNIYLAPHGDIFISSHANGGSTIDTLPVNSGSGNVLPNSTRDFKSSWLNGFPQPIAVKVNSQPVVDSNGNQVYKLKWDYSKLSSFRFGKYYAHLALTYSNGSRPVLVTGSLSFWVIPWKLILLALLIVGLIGLAIYNIFKGFFKRLHRTVNKIIKKFSKHKA